MQLRFRTSSECLYYNIINLYQWRLGLVGFNPMALMSTCKKLRRFRASDVITMRYKGQKKRSSTPLKNPWYATVNCRRLFGTSKRTNIVYDGRGSATTAVDNITWQTGSLSYCSLAQWLGFYFNCRLHYYQQMNQADLIN